MAANGGIDLVYLPSASAIELVGKIVIALMTQDYASGIFVDDKFGTIPGTLPLSAINLRGSTVMPVPAMVTNFRSFAAGCGQPLICAVSVADHTLQQGQGMHGNFSRADTSNFMAAIGPSFRSRFVDPTPVSNADVGATIAQLLGLKLAKKGDLVGRILSESLGSSSTPLPQIKHLTRVSEPAANGLRTVLQLQIVGDQMYFDAAGFPGRTVGLEAISTEFNGNGLVNLRREKK